MQFHQNTFTGGELGYEMVCRYDLPVYNAGCKTLLNFTPTIQGGIKRRKGFVYKYATKNPTQASRLIKFSYSETDSFVLEFGNNYVRFIQNGVQLTSGGSPYEIVSPYGTADLPKLKYRQVGDIVYFAHPNVPPKKLTRIANSNWAFADVAIEFGPVEEENKNKAITAYVSGGTHTEGGSCTITFSSSVLTSAMVGWSFRFVDKTGNTTCYAEMTAFISGTAGTFTALDDLSSILNSGNATYRWSLPAWTSANGFPSAITFHEQRLVYAGTTKYPLTVWGSISGGNFENFEAGTKADDAYIFEIAGLENKIQWLKSDNTYIACGSLGGIGLIGGGNNVALTPTNVTASVNPSYGSADVDPTYLNNTVTYAPSNGKSLLELHYSDTTSTPQYEAVQITSHNKNIFDNITQLEQAEQPDSTIYAVSNGKIIGCIRSKDPQITAMYRIETDGLIESIVNIPTTDDDQLWAIINRGGNRYIETINQTSDEIFVDSAVIYNGTPTRTFTGLTNLANKTVYVSSKIASGWFLVGEYTVASNGTLTIPNNKETITYGAIGLKYDSKMETMPIVISSQYGVTYGKKIKINKVKITLQGTALIKVASDKDSYVFEKRKENNTVDTAPNKYGKNYPEVLSFTIPSSSDTLNTVKVDADSVFDAIIHGLVIDVEVEK